ncbi:metal cation symporter ZIP14-like [Dreissena polymorpha]|uniref:metal cation symporter ZIP14-like n=1 Tax=Dreissena polymorpha TaxID=45954 RepID=UPI0022653912|nr:metal cation symporter ZIP14-like [Dreissena polymorpha]
MGCWAWLCAFLCLAWFKGTSCLNTQLVNEAIVSNFKTLKATWNLSDSELYAHIVNKISRVSPTRDFHIDDLGLGSLNTSCHDDVNECEKFLQENCVDVSRIALKTRKISSWFPYIIYEAFFASDCQNAMPVKSRAKSSSAQAWGYGLGFVTLICIISNVGAIFTPFMDHRYFQRVLLFCVALAVGTLCATGMLVLIPESMHLTADDSPVPDYHLKMSTAMGGLYFFYISEKFLKMWFNRKKKGVPREHSEMDLHYKNVQENGETTLNKEQTDPMLKPEEGTTKRYNNPLYKFSRTKKLTTVALMIMIGDALHNFVDGISIGAAFTEDTYLGISVSLAVVCEELPHELGDIAILLHSGLTMKRSLLYNFLAATTCYIGLVIGILLGENTDANTWIFAIAGGMFVYISLVDMIPEMGDQLRVVVVRGDESVWAALFLQNVGLIAGYDEQNGFRKGRSTSDHLASLT